MRFPIRDFDITKQYNPYWSDYTCFCKIVFKSPGINKTLMRKYFNKLIDKDEYNSEDKNQVFESMWEEYINLTNKKKST